MGIYKITTKDGRTLRSRYEGTKKQAENYAKRKYIKGSFKVSRDKKFENKWKIR